MSGYVAPHTGSRRGLPWSTLKEAGAGFHLESLTAEERAEKSDQKDTVGYIRRPQSMEPVRRKPDMRRRGRLRRTETLMGRPLSQRRVLKKVFQDVQKMKRAQLLPCEKTGQVKRK